MTVTVTCPLTEPEPPVHAILNEVVVASAAVVTLPLGEPVPIWVSLGSKTVHFAGPSADHDSFDFSPLATVDGFATMERADPEGVVGVFGLVTGVVGAVAAL